MEFQHESEELRDGHPPIQSDDDAPDRTRSILHFLKED
jgi:hypothetical protein